MKTDSHCDSEAQRRLLDRVAIAAAVTALYGPEARVRSMTRISRDREFAWVRDARLGVHSSQRPPALARSGPAFERGRP